MRDQKLNSLESFGMRELSLEDIDTSEATAEFQPDFSIPFDQEAGSDFVHNISEAGHTSVDVLARVSRIPRTAVDLGKHVFKSVKLSI